MENEMKKPLKSHGYNDEDDVLRTILEPSYKIEFIRVIFPDILGRPMDFSFPSGELDKAFREGKGFDGSSVEGFVRVEESDLVIKPDPKTFRLLPWSYQGFSPETAWREAVMFGEILTPERTPYEGDARHILKKSLGRAKDEFGVDSFMVGPEMEFFLFPNDREPQPLDDGGYFFAGRHGEIRKETQLLLKRMGILSEYDHHEAAAGQHEIDFRYAGAMEMADTVMLVRYMVKRVARMHGLYATFMPKPVNGCNGSGMHVHQSLWKDGKNLFFDAAGPYQLSEMARSYIGGLMHHAREFSAVYNQWVNSYKRLIDGFEAPVYIAWGQKNRSAYIRVPRYLPGQENATRIELRSPDPGCNVYAAFAAMLEAGLAGVRNRYPLPDPVEDNIYEMSGAKQKKRGIQTLPRNLDEAVRQLEKSAIARAVMGDHMHSHFIANKREEIDDYGKNTSAEFDKQVSDYETLRYLPIL